MKKVVCMVLAACLALAVCAGFAEENMLYVINPMLTGATTWYARAITEMDVDDYCYGSSGAVYYRPTEIQRQGISGRKLADGGFTSVRGTFSFGAGAGIDAPELWYVSFTFTLGQTSEKTIWWNTYAMVQGTLEMKQFYADTERERKNQGEATIEWMAANVMEQINSNEFAMQAEEITQTMLESESAIAIQYDDVVYFMKPIGGGRIIVGIDSLEMYNEFYAGSIRDYIVLD